MSGGSDRLDVSFTASSSRSELETTSEDFIKETFVPRLDSSTSSLIITQTDHGDGSLMSCISSTLGSPQESSKRFPLFPSIIYLNPSPPPPSRSRIHLTPLPPSSQSVILHPTSVNLDAMSAAAQTARGMRVPYEIGNRVSFGESPYFNDLLSLLTNFRSRSTAGYLHMSVPSTQSGCAYVLSVAQHLSILEERLHHSVFIYTPFRRNGEDCFVSNGEWVYTVVIGLLGVTVEVLRGTKAIFNAWEEGGEEGVRDLIRFDPMIYLLVVTTAAGGEAVRIWVSGRWDVWVRGLCLASLALLVGKVQGGKGQGGKGEGGEGRGVVKVVNIKRTICCYAVLLATVARMFTDPFTCFVMLIAHTVNIEEGQGPGVIVKIAVASAAVVYEGGWFDWAIAGLSFVYDE
ncbi:hypothetical protein TrRE_jg9873 [Triparma retinervis]|uniref:Uncharacterized protein n=1 Tax=Triparma retinervis TaxID=2557542 RepID=A0A9W7F8G0_9STRA|nr:hypothetical protein TrRE_jg9873 [Triparma retinervis]